MTTINTRASVLAVKPETTEGTPAKPAAATDFIAQQDDITMEPAFEQLENAELKNSLGRAKTLVGLENPTASFSHYFRASGVEGQAPNYGEILKAIFGTENVDSDEESTTTGSTTSVVELASDGADHQRGTGLLIKDGTNGYSVRPVHSQSTNSLTLGFNLSSAPGNAVAVGKCVTYIPANSSHQTLSLWEYLGNGGGIELISGSRPVGMDLSFEAGQYANANYSFEGIGFYYNPIEITGSNKFIDFDDGGGEENASITEKTYKDPHDVASAIEDAINALTTDTVTVVYSDSDGKYTCTSDGSTFELLFATGTNNANSIATTIGYTAANKTGALTYESESALDFSADYTPSYDSANPVVCKNMDCFIGEADDSECFDPSSVSISMATPKADTLSVCAESGKSGSIISSREITIDVVALLPQYCADRFRRMRENSTTRFFIAGGPKEGGNFVAGKVFGCYAPTCTVTSISIADNEGRAEISISLSTFVDDDGNGEFYVFFL